MKNEGDWGPNMSATTLKAKGEKLAPRIDQSCDQVSSGIRRKWAIILLRTDGTTNNQDHFSSRYPICVTLFNEYLGPPAWF